ncbi:hypothetical protein [Corynebacterium argentoratense]|uniref:hypothetical protein n=1 Tax=Corynebacterium argentoratense TaxID=42817 RepID=UPI0028D90CDD|nr:hypothetical protein [Corynebacterium argentoratense]
MKQETTTATPTIEPTHTTALLEITNMPRSLRRHVEQLMLQRLPTPAASSCDYPDPCTQWRRSHLPATIGCTQRIDAVTDELADFADALTQLAQQHGFSACLS